MKYAVWAFLVGGALAVGGVVPPAAAQETDWAQVRKEWNAPTPPFRMIGNVHYVGTAGLAVYLISTPEGHILIDGALEESVDQISANIEALGFKLQDVKILLVNHAHWDHSGGLAELRRRTGARLLASAADRPALEAGTIDYRPDLGPAAKVQVDALIKDGEKISLGGVTLTTLFTPGHTKGSTSWTLDTGGARVIFTSSITVADQPLVRGKGYDEAPRDFRKTFARLRKEKADVYLAFHAEAFDMDAKRKRLEAGDGRAFVDPAELQRRVAQASERFERQYLKEQTEARAAAKRAAKR